MANPHNWGADPKDWENDWIGLKPYRDAIVALFELVGLAGAGVALVAVPVVLFVVFAVAVGIFLRIVFAVVG